MATSETTVLTAGIDTFTLLDLLKLAARHKGLKLVEGASRAYSEPIKTYALDDRLLAFLSARGIRREPRPGDIFTLVDENPQEKIPGHNPSDYWNFKRTEDDRRDFDLQISLGVGFEVNAGKRGIVLWPKASGTYVSPVDRLPNLRMFQALVESDKNAPAVAKEIAAYDRGLTITWSDLGLGGIRRLASLFREFADQNAAVEKLGQGSGIFNPAPYPQYRQPGDELFIAEPAQPRVFEAWRVQLETYRSSLAV